MVGFSVYFANKADRLPCMWEREKLKMTTEVLAPGTR
jgi:hypothetical protein